MDIEYYDKPAPHIIIRDLLQPRQAKNILDEAIKLKPYYECAATFEDEHDFDGCDECLKGAKIRKESIRDNEVIYLDNHFSGNRIESKTLTYLHDVIQSLDFQKYFDKKGFFHLFRHVNTSETILSRYGKCDFYGFHTDTKSTDRTGRMITLCYYFNEEPERFKGGELIITGDTIADKKMIKVENNMAVIFQSDTTVHAVNTVDIDKDDFNGGRFSINFWLGVNSEYGHRFRL